MAAEVLSVPELQTAIAEVRRRSRELEKALNAAIREFERDTSCTVFVEQVPMPDGSKVIVKAAI